MEYLKVVTLGFGVTMAEFLEALTEDARVRHQIVYSDDDLAQMLSSGNESDEGVVSAQLNDLQNRPDAGEYSEHGLAEIAMKAKFVRSQQPQQTTAMAPPQDPSSSFFTRPDPRRESKVISTRHETTIEAIL